METVSDFIFWGSQITADGDFSHEIKRCLLLGRKVMTKLGSIFKSWDITVPSKVHLVKAMVFPLIMYECESWTIKKTWAPKNWWFWTMVLEKTLESPLDCKEIQPVHSSKPSILQCSAFFTVLLLHPYMTAGKTIALTRWTFVGKVMSLLRSNLVNFAFISFALGDR